MKARLKGLLPPVIRTCIYRFRLVILRLQRGWFSIQHQGDRYLCNFCGQQHDAFMPDGEHHAVLSKWDVRSAGYRQNCRCPGCYSKDRDRLVYEFLKLRTSLFDEPMQLLHMAPEPSLKNIFQRAPQLTYVNADLDERLADRQEDITQLQFDEASFDAVICNHVLEHVPNDALAMRELNRVLKPGGWAILLVPIGLKLDQTIEDPSVTDPTERARRFGQVDHVRIYGQDYTQRLEKAGFQVEEVKPNLFLSTDEIDRLAILPEESIFYCTKPKP